MSSRPSLSVETSTGRQLIVTAELMPSSASEVSARPRQKAPALRCTLRAFLLARPAAATALARGLRALQIELEERRARGDRHGADVELEVLEEVVAARRGPRADRLDAAQDGDRTRCALDRRHRARRGVEAVAIAGQR